MNYYQRDDHALFLISAYKSSTRVTKLVSQHHPNLYTCAWSIMYILWMFTFYYECKK